MFGRCLHLLTTLRRNNNSVQQKTGRNQVTSGVERAAAEGSGHRRLSLPAVGLHDELVALHQPLADELLKDLRGTHDWAFVLPPGKRVTHTSARQHAHELLELQGSVNGGEATFKLLRGSNADSGIPFETGCRKQNKCILSFGQQEPPELV